MKDRLRHVVVGCGGMGHRHIRGLAELERVGESRFDLVAVCDPDQARTASILSEVEGSLGGKPLVYAALGDIEAGAIDSVTITTPPKFHPEVALLAMERGWHALVEKPLAPTMEQCLRVEEAAARSGTVLSVAENFRRDPVNRLIRAALDGGIIGELRYLLQQTRGAGGDRMIITDWRHKKEQGGPVMDIGVHNADMMEYLMGPIQSVHAVSSLEKPTRHNPTATGGSPAVDPGGVYRKWQEQMPESFAATGEDVASALIRFQSGAVGHYREDHAGAGPGLWRREVHGSTGWISCPRDRSGEALTLHSHDHGTLNGEGLLHLLPDFTLDRVTAILFGGDRLSGYGFSFPEADRKILAIEYAELADRIEDGGDVEVDAAAGRRAVALIEAMFASNASGRPVAL
jgi:predicted dehydrogenase